MATKTIATDIYQVSDHEKCQMLKNHFNRFFSVYCSSEVKLSASSEIVDGLHRHVSGIASPFLNAIVEVPEGDSAANLEKQLLYFNKIKVPFIWYIDETSAATFKEKLLARGFQDIGIFQGVIGPLDKPLSDPEMLDGCAVELVKTEKAMHEFAELVCPIFEIQGESKTLYTNGLWKLANAASPTTCHWIARKEGVVVSAISTFIEGPIVSFWNGASLPAVRRQGFSTAIRKIALQDAVSRGCRFGTSYLLSEGLALGICNQLGYETKWRFNAFLSPQSR